MSNLDLVILALHVALTLGVAIGWWLRAPMQRWRVDDPGGDITVTLLLDDGSELRLLRQDGVWDVVT